MSVRPLFAALVLLTFPLYAQSDQAFMEWARDSAVPVDESGRAFRMLDRAIADARLIGIGESVHETEPFLSFRVQLLKDLIRRHRVTALVLESGLPEVMAADEYVRGRSASVDFAAALPGYFGGLDGFRDFLVWLRAWNLGEGRAHPVAVYGADLPGRAGSMVPALDRLQELAADDAVTRRLIDAVRPVAVQVSSTWWKGASQKYDALSPEAKSALAMDVSLLADRVNHLAISGGQRREWAKRMVVVIDGMEKALRIGAFHSTVPRDSVLAENTLWVLGRLAPGERAVYLAHNAHVQRVPIHGAAVPPGSFLGSGTRFDVVLGRRYFAIGTAYGGPAMDDSSAPVDGSLDGVLAGALQAPSLLLLHPATPLAEAWLSQEHVMRFQTGSLLLAPGRAFDAIAYFDRASRAAKAQ